MSGLPGKGSTCFDTDFTAGRTLKRGPAGASGGGAGGRSGPSLSAARRGRLPGRGLGPGGWAARPNRFRHPGRLRVPAEAEQPHGQVGQVSLKRQQEGFVGEEELWLHTATMPLPG
jgi:hypothetical protein